MKLARNVALTLALAFAVGACDGNGDVTGPGVTVADFSGTWSVQSFTYVADADPSTSTNLAAIPESQGGPYGITTMTISNTGSFTGALRLPGAPVDPLPIGGQIVLNGGNSITVDFNAATEQFGVIEDETGTFSFSNNRNTLTLVLPDVTFDHTLSGATAVDSDLTIVATK